MTSASDYRAYIKTREYQRLPWKAKIRVGWEEDKRRWREHGWLYRIFVGILLKFITIPLLIAFVIIVWALSIIAIVASVIFEALCHWQTYAIIGTIIAIIMLVHFGII